jgi:hypothetical protein
VRVEIELLSADFVDRDAFEDQIFRKARFNRARLENRIGNTVFRDAAFDQVDADIDPAGHLDSPAEGDLAITLRPVDIAHRQPAAFDVDGKINL